MLRLGTTPKHTFKIDFDTSLIQKVKITYAQKDKLILSKYTEDCVLLGDTISVNLSQEDTFLFNKSDLVQIQVRVLTKGGDALASAIRTVCPGACLDDEVL